MVEQPKARQARLERLREHNREQRAAEQAKARQARLARIQEASRRRRQAERQSEAQQTTRQAFWIIRWFKLLALLWYFTLNTEKRWRALQAGCQCVYIRQHSEDACLSVDELHDMVSTYVSVTTLVLSGEHVPTAWNNVATW